MNIHVHINSFFDVAASNRWMKPSRLISEDASLLWITLEWSTIIFFLLFFYLKFQISFRLNVERESRHALSQQFVFNTYKKLITELCDILPRVLFGRFSF